MMEFPWMDFVWILIGEQWNDYIVDCYTVMTLLR